MEIDTNIVNLNTIKESQSKKFENINTENMEDAVLRKVTDDFESFFMQQLLDISLKSTPIAGEGSGSDIIKGMYTESLSQQSSGTVGISDMLYNFLSERKK